MAKLSTVTAPKTILCVMAHPDDESFGMGGTLALYAALGHKVHLLTATKGEAGEVEEQFLQKYNSIAELRTDEMCCAAKNLNLASVDFLDYRDSGMAGSEDNNHPGSLFQAPVEEVAGHILTAIRKLKPDVVLTFDPIGGYRHPDHIAVHNATVLAFEQSADPAVIDAENLLPHQPARLYFHTMPVAFMRFAVKLMRLFGKDPRRFGKNQDIDLVSIAEVNFPIHVSINYSSVQRQRDAASACHASQGGGKMGGGILGPLRRIMAKPVDNFMQAYPPADDGQVSTDLFDGLS